MAFGKLLSGIYNNSELEMSIIEIKENETVLARYIPADQAWGEGLKFFSRDDDYVQVGTWGYEAGKALLAHRHNISKRDTLWTQEVIFVRHGSVLTQIYDSNQDQVAELTVKAGDVLVLLAGGHGYTILEDGTQVLEVKNGPYPGAEADRTRL